jgi:hypothetical protein
MRFGNGRATRVLAAGAIGLLGLTLVPGAAGAAISTTTFCANVPSGQSGFTDIGNTAPHTRNIECLKGSGVTAGTTPTTYSPTANVTRAQMATFIANMVDRANQLDSAGAPDIPDLPTAGASADKFSDDEGSVHENNINRLAQAGIVAGTSATTFSPAANVSRAQMASFIAQALAFIRGGALPEGSDAFTDDETSVHEANINRLANADIVDGTSATTYNPDGLVSRAQMASFVVQAMADLNADGFIGVVPGSVQQLNITPTTAASVELANDNGANVTTDDRTYTVSGLAAGTYRIRLYPSANVTSAGGSVTFADVGNDGIADQGAVGAQILSINGTPQGAGTSSVGGLSPANGSISFVVDATTANSSVTPVIFVDGGANTELELDANDRPTEAFGVGGAFVVLPPEGAIGPVAGVVVIANPDGDVFTTATNSYFYDSNDTFQLLGAGITMAQFEQVLSSGDTVSGSYNPDPAGGSTFNITADAPPPAPTNVAATVTNKDGDASANDVTVTFTPGAGTAAGVTFQVQRSTVTPVGACGPDGGADVPVNDWTNQGSAVAGSPFNQDDVANGCYAYRVIAVNPVSNVQSAPSGATGSVAVPAAADSAAPEAEDTELFTSAGFPTDIDQGDVIKVCFDETMAALADADVEAIQISDTDVAPSVLQLTSGTNATFALNVADSTDTDGENGAPATACAAGRELTITITAAPTVVQAGTAPGVQVTTASVTNAANLTDTSGNLWAPAGDPDVSVNTEAGAEPT